MCQRIGSWFVPNHFAISQSDVRCIRGSLRKFGNLMQCVLLHQSFMARPAALFSWSRLQIVRQPSDALARGRDVLFATPLGPQRILP